MKARITPVHLWFSFAALILVTRSTQFALAVAPPDPTIPLMLLGGMWIRRWPGFAGLLGTAFAADWIATGSLGVPDYCLSPAYTGLVPAYLVVWWSGWWLRAKGLDTSLLALLGAALVASSAAFVVSNAFWYAFSEQFDGWRIARFAVEVLPYAPAYVATALGYVGVAWIVRLTALHLARDRSLEPAA